MAVHTYNTFENPSQDYWNDQFQFQSLERAAGKPLEGLSLRDDNPTNAVGGIAPEYLFASTFSAAC
jgi:hypothetical protein